MEVNDDELWAKVERISTQSMQAMPDCGQFAYARETQGFVESDAIREAYSWLAKNECRAEIQSFTQPDPPDLVATLVDGSHLSFEFAVIVHQETIKVIKHRSKNLSVSGEYQNWAPTIFQQRISELLVQKESIFATHLNNGKALKPIILVLGSDSLMSHPDLVDGFSVRSQIFDRVLVHFGYIANPSGASESEYLIMDITEK